MFAYDPNQKMPLTMPQETPAASLPAAPVSLPEGNIPAKRPGMFAGMQIQPGNAIAGYLAGRFPQYAQSFLAPMMQRQQMQMQMAHMQAQQQYEYQRQLELEKAKAQLRLQYPDGEFAQELIQGGTVPGSPEWTQAMATRAKNSLDPVVITPQGPMLRSQIVNAPQAGAPAPQGVTFTPIDGGPTPQASGGFRP